MYRHKNKLPRLLVIDDPDMSRTLTTNRPWLASIRTDLPVVLLRTVPNLAEHSCYHAWIDDPLFPEFLKDWDKKYVWRF